MTPEELVADLEDCVRTGLYFEISGDNARTLLEYIRELEVLQQIRVMWGDVLESILQE